MNPTIYVITYNEQLMLPIFIAHYRAMFPGCHIVVYDNQSTDSTVAIALAAGCEVRPYDTGGKLSDNTYLLIKNHCWKEEPAATPPLGGRGVGDWVLIVDCDELCQINWQNLKAENRRGTTLVTFTGYNMVNLTDTLDIASITHAVRAPSYDKPALFNRRQITEINYAPGAHTAAPRGYVQQNQAIYELYHYKYINPDYMVNRHRHFAGRLSEENKARGYGGHYQYPEPQIRAEFETARAQAIKIL